MKARISTIFFLLIFMAKIAHSQTAEDITNLNFSYLGPALSFAYNNVKYTDWFETTQPSTETKKMSGYIASGGIAFNIFAADFCGDLQIKYANNNLENTLKYIEVSAAGKYLFYQVSNEITLGSGLGIYLEIPMPNEKNNGSAGLQLPFTILVDTSRDTKLFMDVFFRYGTFGTGTDTRSISVGSNVGFIFKVGRV